MARFDRLLDGEYRNLVALEEQVALAKLVCGGTVYWNSLYAVEIRSPTRIIIVAEDEERINRALDVYRQPRLKRIECDALWIQRWAECKYIFGGRHCAGELYRFYLTLHGEDYLAYRRKSRFARWLIDLLMKPARENFYRG